LKDRGRASGLSFALNGDGLVGIDLDDCRDPGTGDLEEWASDIIGRFRSYAEVSPSGRGIRIFLRGTLPPGGCKKGAVEVYGTGKFLSVTGQRVTGHGAGDGIRECEAELLAWHQEVFGSRPTTPTKEKAATNGHSNGQLVLHNPPHIDQGRLASLFRSKPKAGKLFNSERNCYASQSEADLALANYAVADGWTDQEVCDLLVQARLNADAEPKPVAYFVRTIAKAREPQAGKGGGGLAAKLRERPPGTDTVRIGPVHAEGGGSADAGPDVEGVTMADVAKLIGGIKFLVRDWVPFGMVTGIVAEPGTGKSAFALWLARTVLMGGGCPWFNGLPGPQEPGYVLWCPTENDTAITLQRMRDWHIPMDRLIQPFKDDPLRPIDLTDAGHLELIEALVRKHRPPMVVVDSLRGGHGTDENNSQVGRVLQNLASIAERTNAAFPVVHHTRKLLPGEEITANSCRGSNAILAMMRSLIGVDRPDPKGKWCRLRVLKENLGIAPQPVGFQVTGSGLVFGPAPEQPHRHTATADAESWLRRRLASGEWCASAEVLEEAEQLGYSRGVVQRAQKALGIVPPHGVRKDGKTWQWRLPPAADKPPRGEGIAGGGEIRDSLIP
jgi:hypothetical protein